MQYRNHDDQPPTPSIQSAVCALCLASPQPHQNPANGPLLREATIVASGLARLIGWSGPATDTALEHTSTCQCSALPRCTPPHPIASLRQLPAVKFNAALSTVTQQTHVQLVVQHCQADHMLSKPLLFPHIATSMQVGLQRRMTHRLVLLPHSQPFLCHCRGGSVLPL